MTKPATNVLSMQPSNNVRCMIIDSLMNSTEVQNPQCKLDDKCLCLSNVFGSVLACAKFAHVSEAFLLTLQTLTLPQTKAFLCFIAFSGSPTAVHRPLHALRYYTVGMPV